MADDPQPLVPYRQQVTWTRWDARGYRQRTTHPWMWLVTEPDGYVRTFDTRCEADEWITNYLEETDGTVT